MFGRFEHASSTNMWWTHLAFLIQCSDFGVPNAERNVIIQKEKFSGTKWARPRPRGTYPVPKNFSSRRYMFPTTYLMFCLNEVCFVIFSIRGRCRGKDISLFNFFHYRANALFLHLPFFGCSQMGIILI